MFQCRLVWLDQLKLIPLDEVSLSHLRAGIDDSIGRNVHDHRVVDVAVVVVDRQLHGELKSQD